MNPKILLPLFAFFLILSCKSPVSLSTEAGFNVTIPDGWKISDQEVFPDGSGYYGAIEKKGATESGIATITWIVDGGSPEELIGTYFEGLLESGLMEPGDLFREPIEASDFNGNAASMATYNALVMGLEHQGTAWAFSCGDRDYLLVFQEALEDTQENRAGFQEIRKSFQCLTSLPQ